MSESRDPIPPLPDRYEVRRELGRGAQGRVVLAWDRQNERDVAIKLLEDGTSASSATRFLDEIRTAGNLTHSNILTIYDSGDADGVLYYVMPFVRGESLRERLDREGTLSVEEATRIVRLVAGALGFAHAQGVVHRDVKPANILLDAAGNVWIADFGVARALTTPAGDRRTQVGQVVGTAHYMSPEQALGRDADGRSDQYSLACVLHEALTGALPFAGDSREAIMQKHVVAPPPSTRELRADVPGYVDAAIGRALAKQPDDRHATAEAFARALALDAPPGESSWLDELVGSLTGTRAGFAALVAVTAFVLAALFGTPQGRDLVRALLGLDNLPDAGVVAVLPAQSGDDGLPAALEARLRDAFGGWDEIDVADPTRLSEATGELATEGRLTLAHAERSAREVGAGRFVLAGATPVGAGLRIDLTGYEVGRFTRAPRRATVLVPAVGEVPDSVFRFASAEILVGPLPGMDAAVGSAGTRSLTALGSYAAGVDALAVWNLEAAAAAFRGAGELDPGFIVARLRLAQTRSWLGDDRADWAAEATAAFTAADRLNQHDRLLSEGLHLLINGQPEAACSAYRGLVDNRQLAFEAWYGLGECLRSDDVVLPDPDSPSGWSFRSSYQQSLDAYQRAYEALPARLQAFEPGGWRSFATILGTRWDRPRAGRGVGPDAFSFYAWPVWQGDSIALIPYTTSGTRREPPARQLERAIDERRRVFRDIASIWVAAFPESADALHTSAIALEMTGDSSSMATIERARSVARDDEARRRLAAEHVWLLVKHGVPHRTDRLVAARELADSLLASIPADTATAVSSLAPLAALIGRPSVAARLDAMGASGFDGGVRIEQGVMASSARLQTLSASGVEATTLQALETQLFAEIENTIDAESVENVFELLVERAAILAFPAYVSRLFEVGYSFRSPVGRAQGHWTEGRATSARMSLDSAALGREDMRPADLSLDVLYAEARLLAALGDSTAAIARLLPTLEALRWVEPRMIRDQTVRSAVLVPALALLAACLRTEGSLQAAALWAGAARILWRDAEPSVSERLERWDALLSRYPSR